METVHVALESAIFSRVANGKNCTAVFHTSTKSGVLIHVTI